MVIVAVVIGVVVVQVVSRCRTRHNNIGSVPQLIDYQDISIKNYVASYLVYFCVSMPVDSST